MFRRVLCFLTAAAFLLMPLAAPADPCPHVDSSEYVLRGYVEPQPGKPGWSGDFVCPLCGEVMIPGGVIVIGENGGQPDGRPAPFTPVNIEEEEPEARPEPETPAQPAEEAEPEKPETPAQPEPPAQPETPAQTGEQAEEEKPVTPAQPEAQAEPAAAPEEAVVPANPGKADAEAEKPAEPETPAVIAAGEESRAETVPEAEPEPLPEPVPETVSESTPSVVIPTGAEGSSASPGGDQQTATTPGARERFSKRYPWRRVRMTPQPGIQAPAAGVLVWPVPASPFQQLLK